MPAPEPPPARARAARLQSGQALAAALGSTFALLRWLLLALAALYLCSGFTRVGPQEDALIFRLGVLQKEVHPPGLLLALPPPFDRVVRVPTRVQHQLPLLVWTGDEETKPQAAITPSPTAPGGMLPGGVLVTTMPAEMMNRSATTAVPPPPDIGLHPYGNGYSISGDVNLVQGRCLIRYRIHDPIAHVLSAQEDSIAPLIEMTVADAATRLLAGMRIDDALGAGLEDFRAAVLAQSRAALLHVLPGIELVAFEVNTLAPPQAAAAAFAEVTSAQVQARTAIEQARTYEAQLKPNAQSEAFRIRSTAEAEAIQIKQRASAEAASFIALAKQHRTDPDLLETRLRAEALEEVLPKLKTLHVLPAGDAPLDLFLPANP